MNWIEEWFGKARSVVFNPSGFFEETGPKKSFGHPLKFAITSLVIMSVLSVPIELAMSNTVSLANIGHALLLAVISGVFAGSIGIIIGSGVAHIFVYLLEGKEYIRTLEVYSYATSINAFLGWVPVVSLGASIYGIYIQIKGIEEYHDFTTARAAVAVLLPVMITFSLVVLATLLLLPQNPLDTTMPGPTGMFTE